MQVRHGISRLKSNESPARSHTVNGVVDTHPDRGGKNHSNAPAELAEYCRHKGFESVHRLSPSVFDYSLVENAFSGFRAPEKNFFYIFYLFIFNYLIFLI